ncbi:MAG: diguanylate cyclase [Fibromonadaceae bacterium]|jgi:diguanylate cyclase (GGDEF)-like protein|nr:diguanylate cyclase [Fibromonadaceae bacterium]
MIVDKDFTVLTVSSNYAGQDILHSILMPYYSIRAATSLGEAQKILKTENINLIILDYMMDCKHCKSGCTLCNSCSCNKHCKDCYEFLIGRKSRNETVQIPVILVGEQDKPESEEQSFALGAADYISKPFRSSIVKARVNNQRLIVRQIKTIEELGLIDHLTGISNRRGFDSRIHLEWLRAAREQTRLSLAIADIDRFKAYNDEYGHSQGDALLRSLAKKLSSMMRRPADFVARWGGEEFVIILPNTELSGALIHSEDIRKSVETMVVTNLPPATISIGVASVIPTTDSSMDEFFNMADKALYKAKETGRNRVCS